MYILRSMHVTMIGTAGANADIPYKKMEHKQNNT